MSLTVQIKTSKKSIRLKMKFDPTKHTVFDIKKAYCDQEDSSKKPDKIKLYKGKNVLGNDASKLQDCGIKGRVQLLTMTFKVIGGALYVPNNNKILNSKRERKLDTADDDIKISQKADCVYYYDDSSGQKRAEMPCGHAFVAQTMFDTIKSVITKNEYEYEIRCPMCKTEFEFDLCAKVADMNDDEYLYFAEEIAKRSFPETKECPTCKADCERPQSLKIFRVNCVSCKGGDWCFICGGMWHGGGFIVCGNNGCPSNDINDVLQNCKEKETTYKDANDKYVIVPSIRACPNCLEFIEHEDKCKHMKCMGCGHDFCFSCLKGQKDGSWQCNSHTYQCPIAPRQKLK